MMYPLKMVAADTADRGRTHGLRNEITTLHESASAGVLFTPPV